MPVTDNWRMYFATKLDANKTRSNTLKKIKADKIINPCLHTFQQIFLYLEFS